MRPRVVRLVLSTVLVATPFLVASPGPAAGDPPSSHPSGVILDWERTSIRTIYGTDPAAPLTPIPVGVLYLGFVSVAMHDAVTRSLDAPRSSEAAAAGAAAHGVLSEYHPDQQADLDADLDATLAGVHDSSAEATGRAIGEQAAARMIEARADDGRDDLSITYDQPMEPGYWQPVGDPPVPMLAPWLGSVDPLVVDELATVDGPDPLTSREYAADYDEVRRLGSADSTARKPYQTTTALFFNSNSATMVGTALVERLEDHPIGLRRTSLLFARMHGAMTDSVIKCWQLKRDIGFWRPFQAIAGAADDKNPLTEPETGWTPLLANPPYSDYVSGHACLTAPAVQTIRMMLGEGTDLTLRSVPTGLVRSYRWLDPIENQAFRARIWGGLHFRDAMVDGYAVGHRTARRVAHELH
jgi:hypothetical protein